MQVKKLMRKNPATVLPDSPLWLVWKLLAHKLIHMVPVVDKENVLQGIITAEDLLKNLVPDYRNLFTEFYKDAPEIEDIEDQINKQVSLKAGDIMNKKVHTTYEDMDVFKALSRLLIYNVRILPVVDDDDHLKGFIVEKDIFKHLFDKKIHLFNKMKEIKPDSATKESAKVNTGKSLIDLAKELKDNPSKYLKFLTEKK